MAGETLRAEFADFPLWVTFPGDSSSFHLNNVECVFDEDFASSDDCSALDHPGPLTAERLLHSLTNEHLSSHTHSHQ